MTDPLSSRLDFRVLLVAPNWLGDVVMFSALVEFLHRQRVLPDGSHLVLGLAVRPSWAALFQDDPRLDFLLPVQKPGRHAGLLGGWRLGMDLRAQAPDAVLLGPPSLRAGIAAFCSGANFRIGYAGDGRGSLLTHGLRILPRGERHHSEELVQLGEALFQALGWDEKAKLPDEVLPNLPGCFGFLPEFSSSESPVWLFAPGATYGSAKSWPLDRALEFASEAIHQRKVRLVVVGDTAASDYAQKLAMALAMAPEKDVSGSAGLVDMTGKTDLPQVVSLMKSCQVFIGIDSGLMHLAGALGVPTVGIFGSSNPNWTSPRGVRTRVVTADGFECRPCYLKTCNQKDFCLDTIGPDRIFSAVDALLVPGEK